MPVENKNSLLYQHTFLNLHLQHIAIGSWPCCNIAAKPTNIFFTVFDIGNDHSSFIRSVDTDNTMPIRQGVSYFIPFNHLSHWNLSPEIKFVSIHFNMELFYGIDIFQHYPECVMWEAEDLVRELPLLLQNGEKLVDIFRINEIIYAVCRQLSARHELSSHIDIVTLQRYYPVLKFVKEHGDASTRVEDLADIMKMRSNVFSRSFTRDLGITPKIFLVNTLMRKASDLLRRPGYGVRQASEELKFSSEYYFSAFFKKNNGMPPKSFQQRNQLKSS